ncbi:hypothetical protein [Medusavirus stheno T3]|uniref:Uncharacterized protein n=1 Tax=Medusavirus stheno T3 TaxID=3069717 RepID=A0A7S7YEC4_9VIRU|nr:hypothetical protein QKU73_gp040 [Acanthamoeba castellanii medusavirus]QPB44221.1 hypothetical protein [Medusavirus stheno T3]
MLRHRLRYPTTSTLTDDALVRCDYTQNGEDDFDFAECVAAVEQSVDLRAYGAQRAVTAFLEDVRMFPVLHQAHQLDGFRIEHLDGRRALFDAWRRPNCQLPSNNRTGVVSVADLLHAPQRKDIDVIITSSIY